MLDEIFNEIVCPHWCDRTAVFRDLLQSDFFDNYTYTILISI